MTAKADWGDPMPQPTPSPVPLDLWRDLLAAMIAYRRAEPWLWMGDAAASVYVDENGQPWFACVLGAGRQVYGLCLYRGANGLRLFRELCESGGEYDFSQLSLRQDAVTVWFGPKSDLDTVQIERYRALSYVPRRGERLAWPDVRSLRPGYFPWHPEESEVRVLLAALPAVVRLASLVRQHPGCYDEHDECELPTLPAHDASVAIDTLEWRLWPTPQEPEPLAPAAFSDQDRSLLQAKGLPVASGVDVEIDVIFMPEPVSDGERPYYPRCILIFRGDNGVCCAMRLVKPAEDSGRIASEMLLAVLAEIRFRPRRLLACRRDFAVQLTPVARQLGTPLKLVPRLASSMEFQEGLAAHMTLGSMRSRS